MSAVIVHPGPVSGSLRAPSSKSYTHRALVVGFLSGAPYRLERPLDADDTRRTAEGLRRLGARVDLGRTRWTVEAPKPGGRERAPITIDCGESGTTLRLLTCVAALQDRPVTFVGRGRLGHRPIRGLLSSLGRSGVAVDAPPHGSSLPYTVRGPVHGGRIAVPVGQTSQFLTGLLLSLPFCRVGSRLLVDGPFVSAPYVRSTLALLRRHGVAVRSDRKGFTVTPVHGTLPDRFAVPADASAAAALWGLAASAGGRVVVRGLDPQLPQADEAVLDALRDMGAEVELLRSGASVTGPVTRPVRLDLDPTPDLMPLAGVLAAGVPGRSLLVGAAHAALKESDRRTATARLAKALGARVSASRGAIAITGRRPLRSVCRRGLRDHRLFMAAVVAAVAADAPSTLGDPQALAKSYPRFLQDARHLGVRVRSERP